MNVRSMFVLACLLLFSGSSAAQEVDSAAYLPSMMTSGERVIVTGAVCQAAESAGALEPRCRDAGAATIRGKVERLTSDVLVVAGPTRSYTFPLDGLARIERPRDPIWDGALIGYAAGVAAMTLMAVGDTRGPHESFISALGFGVVVGSFITGPIGFGIGALGDAVTARPRLVFAAAQPLAASTTGLARRGPRLSVSIGF
jgi:hypothetical protein